MIEAVKKPVAAHQYERDRDNFYTEPAWCSGRLFDVEAFEGEIVEPCAGTGNIMRSAQGAGLKVRAYDFRDRGIEGVTPGCNFFEQWPNGHWPADNIVSNPPYGLIPSIKQRAAVGFDRIEDYFLHLSLKRTTRKVALFLPASWLHSDKRGRWLETLPMSKIYMVGPRPSCPPGRLVMAGMKAGGGKQDFSWFVFDHDHKGPITAHWLRRDA